MRVLGVDPGSRFMGYGVVEQVGSVLKHVANGVIRAGADAPLEVRLCVLSAQLRIAIQTYRPDAVAVEGVFTLRNPRSALILGHARGVALLAAAEANLPVHEYPPARVKRAVGAGGAGSKDAVARMVTAFLGIRQVERSDATDALAVAICHLNACRGMASPPPRRRSGKFAAIADRLLPAYRPSGNTRG